MKNGNVTREASTLNAGFTAFLCAALGSLLLEFCIFQLRGKPAAYATSTLIGMAFSCVTWHRAAPSWAIAAKYSRGTANQQDSRPLRTANLISGLLLAGIGYLGACALVSGWVTPFSAFAICLYLFPWSRIPLCRSGPLVPCAMIAVGAVAHLSGAARLPHPIMLLAAVWMLWVAAGFSWLRLIFLKQKKLKASAAAPRDPAEDPEGVLHN
jgi:hypothetical protein